MLTDDELLLSFRILLIFLVSSPTYLLFKSALFRRESLLDFDYRLNDLVRVVFPEQVRHIPVLPGWPYAALVYRPGRGLVGRVKFWNLFWLPSGFFYLGLINLCRTARSACFANFAGHIIIYAGEDLGAQEIC
jgi:hypothetical protein